MTLLETTILLDADITLKYWSASNYVCYTVIDAVHFCEQLEQWINQMCITVSICINCKYGVTLHFMNAMLTNLNSVENHQAEYKTLCQQSMGPTLVLPWGYASFINIQTQYINLSYYNLSYYKVGPTLTIVTSPLSHRV